MTGSAAVMALLLVSAPLLDGVDRRVSRPQQTLADRLKELATQAPSRDSTPLQEASLRRQITLRDKLQQMIAQAPPPAENPFQEEAPRPVPRPSEPPAKPIQPDPAYDRDRTTTPPPAPREAETPDARPSKPKKPRARLMEKESCGGDCLGRADCGEACSLGGRGCDRPCGGFGGIQFDGWISQGVTINTDSPRNRSNFPVAFNDGSNEYQMNQAYVILQRPVPNAGCCWGVGGRVDLLYGTDARFTTARGLETRGDFSEKWNSDQYGLALPQAYVEVYAPWGNGLTMKLGHFYSILGYESIPAAANFFYSHSYHLQYGEPFTHTGFIGSTRLGPLTVHAGMTRGWDNWEDNNNDFAFLGGVDWTSPDGRTSIGFGIHVGREQDEPPPRTGVRTFHSLVIQHRFNSRWQYVGQYDHGFEGDALPRDGNADWFGLNQYLFYTINSCWKAGLRFEWFRDEDATRIDPSAGGDYYEISLGLNWTPNDRLTIRPEFRWDWTHGPGLRPFGDGRDDQVLVDFDVIWRF